MLAIFILVALIGTSQVAGQDCKFIVQDFLEPSKEPVVLEVEETEIRGKSQVETLRIAKPEVDTSSGLPKGVIDVRDHQNLMLACPGQENVITGTGGQTSYLTCVSGEFSLGNDNSPSKASISCTKSFAESNIVPTNEKCGGRDENSGIIIELGIKTPDGSWFPQVFACYDVTQARTLYTKHELNGRSLKGAERVAFFKPFSPGLSDLYSGFDIGAAYSKIGQAETFKHLVGEDVAKVCSSPENFLSHGQLSPDADFFFKSVQLSTFYYVNAAPQWSKFNEGNWLVVENAVRDLAVKGGVSVDVYTGTFGVLELPDQKGEMKQMYMYIKADIKKVPVPEVFWKIVQHPTIKSCTVAIGHNNVLLKQAPKPICDPLKPDGWPTLSDVSKGYTYYCDYQHFIKAVPYAPQLNCMDLFAFPAIYG